MTRNLGILVATAWLSISGLSLADEKDATPILDKAIAALGGEAKLAKAASFTSKGAGTINIGDNDAPIKFNSTVDGLDRMRSEIEFDFNGMPIKGLTVLNGKKAWRKFGQGSEPLDDDQVESTRHSAYLQAIAATILPLKSKGFQVEAAADGKVEGKPAAVVTGKGPDGKAFTLFLDKETGLPLKLRALVRGFMGEEAEQETTFADYKDFDGVKRATKIESTRDGNPFLKMQYTEFKIVEKHDPSTFAEPD
jgi:hypothetical protein